MITLVTDLPTKFVTVQTRNFTKTIEDYYDGPKELAELENMVDRVARTSQWIDKR